MGICRLSKREGASVKYKHVFLIPEGINDPTSGISVWFKSMAKKSKQNGNSIIVCQVSGKSDPESGHLSTDLLSLSSFSKFLVSVFSQNFIRKCFAKFHFDSSNLVNRIIGQGFNRVLIREFRNKSCPLKITVPLYGGIGSYLSRELPVEIALMSSTTDVIEDMNLPKKTLERKYLPRIKREEQSLQRHSVVVGISESVIRKHTLQKSFQSSYIDSPRIEDPIRFLHENRTTSHKLLPFKERLNVILYIGKLETRKGSDFLLEIWRELNKTRSSELLLYLVGDSLEHQRSFIRDEAGIIALGFVSEREKLSLIECAKCVLIPSRYESFGLVSIEAMSLGTPLIVSAVGGLQDTSRQAKNIITCPVGDIRRFVESITHVLNSEDNWTDISVGLRNDYIKNFSYSEYNGA